MFLRVARLRQPGDSVGREHGGGHDHPGGHAPRRDLQRLLEPQRQPDLHRLQGQNHPRHRPPQGGHRRRESHLLPPLIPQTQKHDVPKPRLQLTIMFIILILLYVRIV